MRIQQQRPVLLKSSKHMNCYRTQSGGSHTTCTESQMKTSICTNRDMTTVSTLDTGQIFTILF